MNETEDKPRFTDEQAQEFAAYHDKFLRGIGCRRDNFHRKMMYLLEKFRDYYLRFDTGVELKNIDGAVDPLTVSIYICPPESSDYEDDILIHNDATHEDVLCFVEMLEKFHK